MKNIFSKKNFLTASILVATAIFSNLAAQGLGNSPYSTFGVGEVFSRGESNFLGMGGSGVSVANGIYANNLNPALLAQNKYTVFEVGMLGQAKDLSDKDEKQREYGGNLHYLNLTFPLAKKGAFSFNLQPYSVMDYESRFKRKALGNNTEDVQYIYKGLGAISRFSMSSGVNVAKGLFVGGGVDFYFGNLFRETTSALSEQALYRLTYTDRTSLNGASFRGGVAYKHKVSNKLFINVGGTYDLAANLKQSTIQTSLNSILSGDGYVPLPNSTIDTLGSTSGGKMTLPQQFRIGMSLESPFKFTVSADYEVQKWSGFRNNGVASPNLRDTQAAMVGVEYTPNASAFSFLKKSTYRLGFSSATTPYYVSNQQIKDNSASLGFMFPLGRSLSYANFSFIAGQRGNAQVIQERYLKLSFGLTLNDRWFYKIKID